MYLQKELDESSVSIKQQKQVIMNELSLFRLKLQYKSENQETGELEKAKTEILVQCVNYTDAEKLVCEIIKLYNMSKFEPCVYDIVKTKFEAVDVYGSKIMEKEEDLTCGLIQHYFTTDDDGLYAVEAIVFGDKEAKEKDLKFTFFIPSTNVADAMNKAKKILEGQGFALDNCLIPSAKLDKAEYVYLRPETSKEIYEHAYTYSIDEL